VTATAGPGRKPADESGAKVAIKLGLSPRHRKMLDDLAVDKGLSRSVVVEKLLERAQRRVDPVGLVANKRGAQ
jgi:hypothetical protein